MTYPIKKQNIRNLLDDFVKCMKHTFGNSLIYIGTTTPETENNKIRDVDVIVVFESISESIIAYSWKIINRLHAKYNIFIDARLNKKDNLNKIPEINRYLLRHCLKDLEGTNPFLNFTISPEDLKSLCIKRIESQKDEIIKIIPRIADDPSQISKIAQCVYDAIRAFLIIEKKPGETPIADKKQAYDKMMTEFPRFQKAGEIYEAYLEPNLVVDIADFIFDSLAVVKLLYYRTKRKSLHDEILLINTPSSIISHPRNDYLKYDHNMPLGLVCLSAYLKEQSIPVRIRKKYSELFPGIFRL